MALYEFHPQKISQSRYICIPSYETIDNITKYTILITVGKYFWNVSHRYSDFHDLNEKLSNGRIIDRSLLPPKKMFGNQSETFIQRRRNDLEQYLKALFTLDPLPEYLIKFLEFEKYEIHSITEALAESLWESGDQLLQSNDIFHMGPLQCHALTEKLKLPKTTTSGSKDPKKDVGHILDFLSKVKKLLICGSNKAIEKSNIIPNELQFSLMTFKSLQSLKIVGCNPEMIKGLGNARKTVTKLNIQDSLKKFKEFFLSEIVHWDCDNIANEFKWNEVSSADFSYNHLDSIDDSIYLLPWVEVLDLSHNRISSVTHLDKLSRLSHLDLSFNAFTEIIDLHTKLGNIVTIKLIGNSISSLKGFTKLYSLVDLDLQNNLIDNLSEISYLINLPCLDKLNLMCNPLVNAVDYRVRVLEQFNSRSCEICLDKQMPTQKELDTVAILQAIRRAKEGAAQKANINTVQGTSDTCDEQVDVIHLRGSHVVSSTCEESTNKLNSKGNSDVDEFRRQVASIRAQGGTGWLRLWNQRQEQMQQSRPLLPPSPRQTTHLPQITSHGNKYPSNLFSGGPRDLILPNWLPGPTDHEFLSTLDSHVASVLTKNPKENGRIIAFYWLVVLWSPSRIRCCHFPALLVILPSSIIIFLLSDLDEDRHPILLPFRFINGKSLTSLSIGHQLHFIKFKEKSCDDFSEYILLPPSRGTCVSCVDHLQKLVEPNIKLKQLSSNIQSQCFSWVALDVDIKRTFEGTITCLALNNGKIVLSTELVCPLLTSSECTNQVIATWDAKEEIVNLEIHNQMEKPKISSKKLSLASTVFTISDKVKTMMTEAGFGVTVWFTQSDLLSVRFPSRENRDEFLDVLTQSRV